MTKTLAKRLPSLGTGEIIIENIYDEDGTEADGYCEGSVSTLRNSYPLKLLVPSNASTSQCKWIYPINFGGGLVGGDSIAMSVHVKKCCCTLLTGQESTKIYHCDDNLQSQQTLSGMVDDGALLCVLSDPVVCYKDADFIQKQEFKMSCQGNLVYLDWLIGGRVALDELWQFKRYQNKTDVYVDGSLVYRDNYNLNNTGIVPVKQTLRHFQVVGSCILLGNKLASAVTKLYNRLGRKKDIGISLCNHSCGVHWLHNQLENSADPDETAPAAPHLGLHYLQVGESYDREVICSVSRLSYTVNQSTISGVYIRFMANSSKKAYDDVVYHIVKELQEVIGGNPFEDKY